MSLKKLNNALTIFVCLAAFFMAVMFLQADKKAGKRDFDRFNLEDLQREIMLRGYTFTVGKTSVSHIPLHRLCTLKEPKDWDKDAPFDGRDFRDDDIARVMTLPTSFDWRDSGHVTPIENQGACGAAWAITTLDSYESAISILFDDSVDLSEQWLIDCNEQGWGCNGGWFAFSELYDGVPLESCYPYTAQDADCQQGCEMFYPLDSWYYVGTSSGVPTTTAIKTAIYDHGPVAAAVYVNSAFQSYTGGIFDTSYHGTVNHCIVLIGWDDAGEYWILKNSWGTGWGEDGYMRIAYGCQSVGYAACYGIPTGGGTPGTITVLSPNGGEVWAGGSVHNILWTSQDVSGNVKIEFTTNNKRSWQVITNSTANDGTYSWTIPIQGNQKKNCFVRITSVDDPGVYDESDAKFTITK